MKNRNNTNQSRRMAGFTSTPLLAVLGACVFNIGHLALAATFISDNDGNWGTPATWNPDPGVPGPGDEVFANHTIIVEADHACWRLHLNRYIGVLSGYTLTIGGGSCGEEGGPVQLTGGGGTLLNQGVFGTSANYPGLSINPGFTWRNQGAFHHSVGTLTVSGTWRNESGGAVYRSGGAMTLAGAWHNEAGSTYDLQTDGALATGAGTFWNRGLLRKSGGAGTATLGCVYNEEGATVEVLSGTLILGGSGTRSNGTYSVADGAALDMTGGGTPTYQGLFSGSGSGRVVIPGGELRGNVACDFSHGLFWQGGSVINSLENRGLLVLETAAPKTVDNGILRNRGTIRHTGGLLSIYSHGLGAGPIPAYWNNEAGALYDIQADGANITAAGDVTYSYIRNYGTLRKSGGAGTSSIAGNFENLGGTVEVLVGTLLLGGGTCSNGTYTVNAGAVLNINSGQNVRYRGTFAGAGAGQVRWDGGNLQSDGAVFNFPNGFYWDGGELAGGLNNQGLLVLDGTNTHRIYGATLNNTGTVRHEGAGVLAIVGGPYQSFVNNLTGAVYEVRTDGPVIQATVGGGGWDSGFYNYGTFRKAAGPGITEVQASTAGGFRNYGGRIEVLSGTLRFANYTHQSGTIRLSGGDMALPDFHLQAGSLEGTGTVNVSGTLTSSGNVSPGLSVGRLDLTGHFSQTAAGTLDIEIGGRNPGEFDQLNVSGNATLNGTLRVTLRPPFLPAPGDQFKVLSCVNRTGVFSVTNIPAGLAVSYDSTGVSLVVTGAAPPYLTIACAMTNTVVVSWPLAEAEGWVLQATNALPSVAAPWPIIPPPYQTNGANLQFLEPAPVGNKFYRLYKL